jgi:cysteine desulfurase
MEYENVQVKAMRDRLEQGIIEQVPHCFITGDLNNRLPNTTDIAFEYIEGEAILMLLSKAGIAASSGSACTSGSLEPSHVMRAMNIPYTAAHGTIRFSFSRYNTMSDVDEVLKVMPGIAASLRKLSPYWDSINNSPVANPEQAFQPTYA